MSCCKRMFSLFCLLMFFSVPVFPQDSLVPGFRFNAFHDDYDLSSDVVLAKVYISEGKNYFGFHDYAGDGFWSSPQLVALDIGQSYDLSIDGDQAIIVGSTEMSGKMRFYARSDGVWTQVSSIAVQGRALSEYVEISQDNAAVLIGTTMNLYRKENGQWIPDAEIIISSEFDDNMQQWDFSLHGDTLVAAVASEVIVFTRTDSGWRREAVLNQAGDVLTSELMSVAVFDNTVLAGWNKQSIFYTTDGSGRWTLSQIVERGENVALHGSRAIIANFDETYHYARNSQGDWQETGNVNNGYLNHNGNLLPFFLGGGSHIALNNSTVLYGGHGSLISSNLPTLTTSVCIDTGVTGDGWGWDGAASCRIDDSNISDPNNTDCVDSDGDGDGYGWNGVETCITGGGEQSRIVDQLLACTDTDGDGFGWNGLETCTPGGSDQSQGADQSLACIDTDGDGYGWNGVQTCIPGGSVQRPIADQPLACIDIDGDGFGWNGMASCRIH